MKSTTYSGWATWLEISGAARPRRGGVAKIGQVQLVQPLLTLAWAAAFFGESVGAGTLIASLAVVASVVATQRARVGRGRPRNLRNPAPGVDFSR